MATQCFPDGTTCKVSEKERCCGSCVTVGLDSVCKNAPSTYVCKGDGSCALQKRRCGPGEAGCHATLAACRASCAIPAQLAHSFTCEGDGMCALQKRNCGPGEAGCHATLEACRASCAIPVQPIEGYDCVRGNCTRTIAGTYGSLAACRATGCETRSFGPMAGARFTSLSGAPMSARGEEALIRTGVATEGLTPGSLADPFGLSS